MATNPRERAPEAEIDLLAERERAREALAASGEAERLAASIDPGDTRSVMSFGARASESIGRTSDELLRRMDGPGTEDSGELLTALAGVMGRIDPGELEEKPGLLGRLFGRDRGDPDGLLSRYDALGGDLDRVFVRLKAYTATLERDNRQLAGLLDANVAYYRELEKYILAGETACRGLTGRIARLEAARDGDSASFELQTLRNALATLQRRVQDLRTSELVAMQTIPMIQAMRRNNRLLIDRIDAALLVTLPAFRTAMAGAVLDKRRRLRGEAMAALDARTRGASLEALRRGVTEGIDEVRALSADVREANRREQEKLKALRGKQ